jgi:hypothetical protein
MPDNNYSDNQIRAIISYIAENSPGGPGAAETGGVSTAPGRPLSEATEENIHAGEQLFVGIAEQLVIPVTMSTMAA